MALPEQTRIFSEADIEFANRLLRRDDKDASGISCDLERPTWAENNDLGYIIDNRKQNPFKMALTKMRGIA